MVISLLILTYILSILHFAYGYREALRISEEDEKVNGWPLIFSVPLGFVFAFFSDYFYRLL
ncbi:hypothetical protein [Bacillus sp. FJAT-47783]|uniref:hypothetical protein n=1 Tax=Bacillus sp. FJAT-47783 TaxID=2922712 RepID=UPI001FAE3774|nr:hypothetical protein [Bacillus sp. FJAT-47783]